MAKKSSNPIVADINRNFLIKWKKYGEKKFNLVSAGKYAGLVGDEYAEKHFTEAMEKGEDQYTFKIRLTFEIKFISKNQYN